jgi:hypothetical protein
MSDFAMFKQYNNLADQLIERSSKDDIAETATIELNDNVIRQHIGRKRGRILVYDIDEGTCVPLIPRPQFWGQITNLNTYPSLFSREFDEKNSFLIKPLLLPCYWNNSRSIGRCCASCVRIVVRTLAVGTIDIAVGCA